MKALLGTADEGPEGPSSLGDAQDFIDALRDTVDKAELALLLEQISRDTGFHHHALIYSEWRRPLHRHACCRYIP